MVSLSPSWWLGSAFVLHHHVIGSQRAINEVVVVTNVTLCHDAYLLEIVFEQEQLSGLCGWVVALPSSDPLHSRDKLGLCLSCWHLEVVFRIDIRPDYGCKLLDDFFTTSSVLLGLLLTLNAQSFDRNLANTSDDGISLVVGISRLDL